jgi:uncharacterized membrane protein YfcA
VVGVGGGVIAVPFMKLMMKLPQRVASATCLPMVKQTPKAFKRLNLMLTFTLQFNLGFGFGIVGFFFVVY